MARDQRLDEFRRAHDVWRSGTAVCDAGIALLLAAAEINVEELRKELLELERLHGEFMATAKPLVHKDAE